MKIDWTKPLQHTAYPSVRTYPVIYIGKDGNCHVVKMGDIGYFKFNEDGAFSNNPQACDRIVNVPEPKVTITKWLVLWDDGSPGLWDNVPASFHNRVVARKVVTITKGEGL